MCGASSGTRALSSRARDRALRGGGWSAVRRVFAGSHYGNYDPARICSAHHYDGVLRIYSRWMDNRPVVWEESNLRHLIDDHPERGIGRNEVEEALADPDRIESTDVRKTVSYHAVVGSTAKGRLLVVVWVDHPAGRFAVHVRQAGRRAARRYYQ